MCGLITVLSKKKKPAGQYAFELYKKQQTRGKDGYGYLAIQDDKIVNLERAKTEAEIRSKLMKEKAEFILFHHRFPTSTDNTVGTTHPMFVSNEELKYDYYFAHNGVITNASQLKVEHNKIGYNYLTEHKLMEVAEYLHGPDPELMSEPVIKFNDSETLAIELARNIEGLSDEIKTTGAAAFWGVAVHKGTNKVHRVYFGKNMGRDLCTFKNKKWFGVTSITGDDLEDMKLFELNLKTRDIVVSDLLIDKAKPVVQTTMGFNNNNHSVYNSYDILENKRYTREEAINTGYSMINFTATWYNSQLFYIPNKYLKDSNERNLPPGERKEINSLPEPKGEDIDPKSLERLDKLAEEYANLVYKKDMLEEAASYGQVEATFFQEETRKIEISMEALEQAMSLLGIDQETVEEVVDLAIQLNDYNESFNYIQL